MAMQNQDPTPPTPEGLRYIVTNLDVGKETLKHIVLNAAEHLERVLTMVGEYRKAYLEGQQKINELEETLQQNADLIGRLNAQLAQHNQPETATANDMLEADEVFENTPEERAGLDALVEQGVDITKLPGEDEEVGVPLATFRDGECPCWWAMGKTPGSKILHQVDPKCPYHGEAPAEEMPEEEIEHGD